VTVSVLAASALFLSAVALNVAGRGDRSVTSVDAITRPETAPVDRQQTSASWGMDREALVQAGYTGRLGATTEAPSFIPRDGFTGRVAETAQRIDWTDQAIDAGFTGRVGGAIASNDWREQALAAGYTGRVGV
jgi:hypothetical protein